MEADVTDFLLFPMVVLFPLCKFHFIPNIFSFFLHLIRVDAQTAIMMKKAAKYSLKFKRRFYVLAINFSLFYPISHSPYYIMHTLLNVDLFCII